jgi:hypothetical protein
MSTPEQQSNSGLQTLETEIALTRQEIEEFQRLPKEERRKQRDEKLAKLKNLQEKLDQTIQEAVRTGRLDEARDLKDQIEKELSELEVLLSPNREKLTDIPFDPNNIFTEEDWKDLQMIVRRKEEPVSCSSLAILDKNRLPELSKESKDLIRVKISNDTVLGFLQPIAWVNYAQLPSEFTKVSDDILQKGLDGANDMMDRYKKSGHWRHFVEPVAWLTIMGHRPELSDDDFKNIEAELEKQKNEGSSGYMIEMGAAIAIIYPDYPLSFTPEQSKLIVDYIKQGITEKFRSVEWYQFSAMAKIVADKLREIEANKELD